MEPTRLFPDHRAVVSGHVEHGGWALRGFLTGRGTLAAFRRRLFRAGHAPAGVLVVPSLAYFDCPGRAGYFAGGTIDARRPQPTINN